MKKLILMTILILLFPGFALSDEIIEGHYCYERKGRESIEEARAMTRTLAIKDTVESSDIFIGSAGRVDNAALTNEILQIIISGYLSDLKVTEHTEKGGTICESIQARVTPEELMPVIERAMRKRAKRIEEQGIENNGCLKILKIEKKQDRYGQRIEVVVKILKATGSLFHAAHRNKRPCFKINMDFIDPSGIPIGGESQFIHESDVEMLPGEVKALFFYPPAEGKAYRVWLVDSRRKTRRQAVNTLHVAKKAVPVKRERKKKIHPAMKKSYRVLEGVEHETDKDGLRVKILADGPVHNYHYFFMDAPPRIVIDLKGMWRTREHPVMTLGNEMVRRIRIGNHRDKLRVVVDLGDKGSQAPAKIQESPKGLVITIGKTN
ncbi:AMIN domain-containing protein [Thermodesulfobacteriota bacterium]